VKHWFLALPIHRKLTAVALCVSVAALMSAAIGLTLFDLVRYRTVAVNDAYALARVVAENSAAAVVFEDAEAARATLASVGVRPNIIRACVYRADGSILAGFTRGTGESCDPSLERSGWLTVVRRAPVTRNGRVLGAALVERELTSLGARLTAALTTGVVMLLIGGLTAIGLAGTLQRMVSRPIVALAEAAREVGHGRRYTLPEIKAPPDETGELVRAFDEMIRRVSESNAALVASNEALRGEVEQRRQMEVEREALLAREREAGRLKDEFLAAVSHELRTPLNAILGWTQILQSTEPDPQTTRRAIASLARNAQAQARVIEDLLDISRIVTGKLQLSTARLDLRDVIEAAVDVVEATAHSRNITLSYELPPEPCLVQGDHDRLRQVLWNLLSNALKFTPSGGRVDVRLVRDDTSYAIEVRDTGIGIPPSFLAHVFERFRQADGSTTRAQGGLGLGLAIVKELTELHGGTVKAESPGPGGGATFTVRLPRPLRPDRAGHDPAAVGGRVPTLTGVSVMVVDDHPDALDLLSHALTAAGARVRVMGSGTEAVAAWQEQPADVLLCDLAMPGMDGFEVLRRVRAIDLAAGRPTHALAVTAQASEDSRIECLKAGFVARLSKPYDIADVVRAVAGAAARNGGWIR